MTSIRWKTTCLAALAALPCLAAFAQTEGASDADSTQGKQARSPWLFVPLISSNPKLGTSLGGMVGYIHKFDEESEPSLVALQGQGSNTSSATMGLGGKLYWNQNTDRTSCRGDGV